MKANETRAAAQPRPAAIPNEPAKKGAFAKLLDQKATEDKPAPLPATVPQVLSRNDSAEAAAPVHAPVPVQKLDGLANEIAIAVRGSGLREVEIQFDSKTFSGLNVRISKENGKLNVRLVTESPEVTRLLAPHTEALAQRLEARGYPAAVVQLSNNRRSQQQGGQGREQQRERNR